MLWILYEISLCWKINLFEIQIKLGVLNFIWQLHPSKLLYFT